MLNAGESTATRQALDALAGLQRTARTSGAQAISAKYAARMAAMGAALDRVTRNALRQQIKLEETQEMARFNADQDREAQQNRQTLLRSLASVGKSKRRALQQRQRVQRTALALLLRALRPQPRILQATPRPAVRRLADRIPDYRSSALHSSGVTTQ